MTRIPASAPVALLVVLLVAGCANNGTGTLGGTNAPGAPVLLKDLHVVDGTLRDMRVVNNGTSAIPAGAWSIHFEGTTAGKANTHNATVQGPAIPIGGNATLSFGGDNQPDWQDGSDLTVTAAAPNGAAGMITVRTV